MARPNLYSCGLLVMSIFTLLGGSVYSQDDLNQSKLTGKIEALKTLSRDNDNLVFVDEKSYKLFISQQPKNYTSVVVFTALEAYHKCQPCSYLHDQLLLVSRAHKDTKGLYFFVVDFERASSIFKKLKLNSAPLVKIIKADSGTSGAVDFDINRYGLEAESLVSFLQSDFKFPSVTIERPANYSGVISMIILVSLLGFLFYKMSSTMLSLLCSPVMWASLCLFLTFIFLSGHMWNHIRGAPFYQVDSRGNPILIYPSNGQQIGKESMLISFLYGGICAFFVLLVKHPQSIDSPSRKRVMGYVYGGALFTFLSFLFACFRIKNQGYPFRLLF
eukprot:Sdes_comp21369_c0_seq1m20015